MAYMFIHACLHVTDPCIMVLHVTMVHADIYTYFHNMLSFLTYYLLGLISYVSNPSLENEEGHPVLTMFIDQAKSSDWWTSM